MSRGAFTTLSHADVTSLCWLLMANVHINGCLSKGLYVKYKYIYRIYEIMSIEYLSGYICVRISIQMCKEPMGMLPFYQLCSQNISS